VAFGGVIGMGIQYEWDPDKAESNTKKHGVSFAEAATVFADTLSMTYYDPDHSEEEDRFITIGLSRSGELLVIGHTDRENRVRIITARRATRREKKFYEEGKD
jgi:uncharacterized DUF497 family protein